MGKRISGRKRETKKPPRDYTSTASLLPTPVDSAPPLCLENILALSLPVSLSLSTLHILPSTCLLSTIGYIFLFHSFLVSNNRQNFARGCRTTAQSKVSHHVVRCQFNYLPVVESLQKFRSVFFFFINNFINFKS